MATLDGYSDNSDQEVSTLRLLGLNCHCSNLPWVKHSYGSFLQVYGQWVASNLIENPTPDLLLSEHCLQRTASGVFESLDGVAMTEFFVYRLKDAETRYWNSSRHTLKEPEGQTN